MSRINIGITSHESWGKGTKCCCSRLMCKLRLRAEMLDHLGKHEAAKADRERADATSCPPGPNHKARLRGDMASKIKGFREKKNWAAAFAHLDDAIRNNRDNLDHRRRGFANTLRKRAQIFKLLGQDKKAILDEKRASALSGGSR